MSVKLPDPAVERQRSSLHFGIAANLGIDVISGIPAVGAFLPPEQQLCERFAVSRTVIREAVKLLLSKGLLRASSGIETWVVPASNWSFLNPLVLALVRDSGRSAELIQHLFAFRCHRAGRRCGGGSPRDCLSDLRYRGRVSSDGGGGD